MPAGYSKRRERVNVVWKPVHAIGVLILVLTFVDTSTVVRVVRVLLFLYFVVSSLDLGLTRYHLWKFEPTTPTLKRYALVTGASSGLGREMSYMLSEKKYSLVLAARTEKVLQRMRAEIEMVNHPAEVLICPCDLSKTEGITKLIDFVKDKKLVIDILVNNAGACQIKDFAELEEKDIDDMMMLGMHALVKVTRAIVPQMIERKIGRVLNISSTSGACALPTAALYGSSKAFVTNFSQALSYELRSTGVTVTCMCPGPIDTNFGKSADMEKAMIFTLPGIAADAKSSAKVALDAMFNGEVLVFDTSFAYLSATLVQCILPGRLATFICGALMKERRDIGRMLKR
ncbi:hypothetical protein PHYSODRAFT_263748 [Plasmopara halstedii]|uniref:Uncharacterized protein n=1 Tax=Plasmopara halstedii TaxID=4781 RepID=A0A0P1B8D4_PLAHL|nr:hypothetical protein PHYSODRAFT_263748 [Plasmopara halstedii]CEG50182.1 hypothetical protein PHYSODRAFT_263748 [Plasmopara halstedii]|eukprot:XP_024586551.1 hypothetical protein PHYSODRAFT_263748 [Plasmopara halstedii]